MIALIKEIIQLREDKKRRRFDYVDLLDETIK